MSMALFAGLGILLGGGLFLANRVIHTVGISSNVGKETVKLPTGSLQVEKASQIGPGLPVCPNCSLQMPGENALAEAIKNQKTNTEITTYRSTDSRASIDDWYVKHLGPEYVRHEAGESTRPEIFHDTHIAEEDIAFIAERGQQVRIVALAMDGIGTKISLIRSEKPATQ